MRKPPRTRCRKKLCRLQRSVEQMAAAKEVADLEYQVAQSNLESLRVRLDAGSIGWHDVQDARDQVNERYNSLQDANFELERARITLLRATGELEAGLDREIGSVCRVKALISSLGPARSSTEIVDSRQQGPRSLITGS